MATSLLVARTSDDLLRVLALRHAVLCEEEKWLPPRAEAALYDRFDCLPTTASIVALDQDEGSCTAEATIRLAVSEGRGLPVELPFDFGPVVGGLEGPLATLDMFAVSRRFRSTRGLVSGIIKMALREIENRGGRHVLTVAPPEAEVVLRSMGAELVGGHLEMGPGAAVLVPLHLELEKVPAFFRESAIDPLRLVLDQPLERRLYRRREVIVHEGEPGDTAFLIMRGSVRVYAGEALAPASMYLLGPGEIFGELCLLDGGEHPGTVEVQSRLVEVSVLPQASFRRRLAEDSEASSRILKILGRRIRRLLLHLPPEQMADVHTEALAASLLLEASAGGLRPVEPGWLASDCGVDEGRLGDLLAPWIDARVLKRNADDLIEVLDSGTLQVIVDHVVEAQSLSYLMHRPRFTPKAPTRGMP